MRKSAHHCIDWDYRVCDAECKSDQSQNRRDSGHEPDERKHHPLSLGYSYLSYQRLAVFEENYCATERFGGRICGD